MAFLNNARKYTLFFLWLHFVLATVGARRSVVSKNAIFHLERRQQSPVLVHKINVSRNVESALEKVARQIHLDIYLRNMLENICRVRFIQLRGISGRKTFHIGRYL